MIDFTIINGLNDSVQNLTLLRVSHGSNSVTAVVINGFSFKSFVAFDPDSFETQIPCARCLRNFQEESSGIASISSNSSLMNI